MMPEEEMQVQEVKEYTSLAKIALLVYLETILPLNWTKIDLILG